MHVELDQVVPNQHTRHILILKTRLSRKHHASLLRSAFAESEEQRLDVGEHSDARNGDSSMCSELMQVIAAARVALRWQFTLGISCFRRVFRLVWSPKRAAAAAAATAASQS